MLRTDDNNTLDLTDGQLLVRLRQDHNDSFAELVGRHRSAAMSVARRVLPGDAASAEDAVEDAIAATLTAIRHSHGPDVDFRPYFLAATRTAAIHISCRRLQTGESTDTWATDGSEFATAESAREFSVLDECFGRLRPAWRQVLWQVDVDCVPSPVVADRLGVSRRAVDAVCQRARRHLARDYVAHLIPVASGEASCASLQHVLCDYGLGMASQTNGELLESHLEHCPPCAARVQAVRRLPEQLPGVLPPAAVGVWKLLASLFIGGGAASVSAVGVACLVVVAPMVASDSTPTQPPTVIDDVAAPSSAIDQPTHTAGVAPEATSPIMSGGSSPLVAISSPAEGAVVVPLIDPARENTPSGVEVAVTQPGVASQVTTGPVGVNPQPGVSIDPNTGAVQVSVPLAVTTPLTTIAIDVELEVSNGGVQVNVSTDLTVPVLDVTVPTVSIAVPLPPISLPLVTLPTVTLPTVTLPGLHLL